MYEHVLAHAKTAVWCIRLDKLQAIFEVLERRAVGIETDAASLEVLAAENRRRTAGRQEGLIGVLPVIGSIVHRGNVFTEASGTASADILGAKFDELVSRSDVGSIILDIDSPGGEAAGIQQLAAKIAGARGIKPIIAQVNHEAASAAYWLATAADEIVATSSGEVGSIGAYAYHINRSGLNETLGIKPTYISYGEYKTEGNPDGPLTDEALAEVQANVDRVGKQFESDVAEYRGVDLATVRKDWGKGRMIDASRAKTLGMVDRIGTLEETIRRAGGDGPRIKRRSRIESLKRTWQIL
jgi:signal peptide peptidase SppA